MGYRFVIQEYKSFTGAISGSFGEADGGEEKKRSISRGVGADSTRRMRPGIKVSKKVWPSTKVPPDH